MKNLDRFKNYWSFSTNHKDIGSLYRGILLIIVLITIIASMIITVLLLDAEYPDLFLFEKVYESYSQEIIPNMFRYVLLPLSISMLNIILLRVLKFWYIAFLVLEVLLLNLLKAKIAAIEFLMYSKSAINIGICVLLLYGILMYFFYDKISESNNKSRDEAQTIMYKEFKKKTDLQIT